LLTDGTINKLWRYVIDSGMAGKRSASRRKISIVSSFSFVCSATKCGANYNAFPTFSINLQKGPVIILSMMPSALTLLLYSMSVISDQLPGGR
jgi:hypothetical protein